MSAKPFLLPTYDGPIDDQGRIPVIEETLPPAPLVERIRKGLDLHKRRLRDATPHPEWPARQPREL